MKADAVSADLRKKLHIVRHVGNYAVHPLPDGSGGSLEVEPGELDALFDALEALFDALYVRPAEDAKRLAALNAKLAAAGKPTIT